MLQGRSHGRLTVVSGSFSDLNLDGGAPIRTRPIHGEWGPVEVPGTATKKRQRIWVVLFFVGAIALVGGLGYLWFRLLVLGG